MATNKFNATEILDTVVNSQKDFVNQVVENTKKFTKNNPLVNDAMEKGKKVYNETVEATAKFAKDATQKATNGFETAKENANQTKNYFQEWFDNQMNMAKQMFNNNSNTGFDFNNMNWMNNFQNPFAQFQNPMMNFMQNPMFGFNFKNPMQDGMDQWNQYYKQYMDSMSNMYGDWSKNFNNFTSADSFAGMKNMNDSLASFFELWAPMFKKMQENKFSMEDFNSLLNTDMYKNFMDKFFSFMPDDAKKMYDQMSFNFVSYMKQMSEMGMKGYNTMKGNFAQMPGMNNNPMNGMWDMYTTWKNTMNEAVSPLTKLMGDNASMKQAMVWNEIMERMVEFNAKNNELQLMMYQHGSKVMEEVAKDVYNKVQQGENFDSIIKIYQQWMMKGDEIFTKLFESDEYSKLMTEVSSLQMKLKMDIEKQMEKLFFANMPIATRTEMDEVYKSIYDLKKMFRNMERIFNLENEPVVKAEAKKTTTNTTAKKATAKKATVKKVEKKVAPKKAAKRK